MRSTTSNPDKDFPLREDIRLLGRILGDTVHQQEGSEVFEVVERIRQNSVRSDRDLDQGARAELESILSKLPRDSMLAVIRSFTYFLHLANIAEDEHHVRRRRAHEMIASPPRDGSLALALTRLQDAGVSSEALRNCLEHALISPVLTAHPTEVSRKSILHCQHQVRGLLDDRDRLRLTPGELAENEVALRRAVLTLWRTRMVRSTRLAVIDEVKNGISYFDETFFVELPRLYCQLEDQLGEAFPDRQWSLPSFFKVGSWIGGDRDGNPFVTAEILRETLRRQSIAAFDFYLGEIHALGRELPLSHTLVPVSEELAALAEASPDNAPQRLDEPYRRALTGIYARLAATSSSLDQHESPEHAVGPAEAYAAPGEIVADLQVLVDSLAANGAELVAGGRLRRLLRAVDVFGFHLAPIDLRQNSEVHARTVGELLARAGRCGDYADLDEVARIALLAEEVGSVRPLYSPYIDYSAETVGELAIFFAARELRQRYGAAALPNCIISKTDGVSDLLEVALLLKEAGLLVPGATPQLALNIIPLFETIDDLQRAPAVMQGLFTLPAYRALIASRQDEHEVMLGYS
ncbi:MAG TPA: phosphoenolpyruvate carboxylase, partial [Candidatus Accumulibacter sp.]|nr:phosphoenolpyruvate carboxylase [Accumulibacter sp.]